VWNDFQRAQAEHGTNDLYGLGVEWLPAAVGRGVLRWYQRAQAEHGTNDLYMLGVE
jgi:hypothetical protein